MIFFYFCNWLSIHNEALPSIWQQPNQRGEEDEETHTREGKSYPDGDTEE